MRDDTHGLDTLPPGCSELPVEFSARRQSCARAISAPQIDGRFAGVVSAIRRLFSRDHRCVV